MRHKIKHKKFGRDRDQRRALFRALITSLCEHGRIETTLPKAKAIKPLTEKLLSKAKKGGLANIRIIAGYVYTENARKNLQAFAAAAEARNGGYTRIYKKGPRASDASPMAIIEFVDKAKEEGSKEGKNKKKPKVQEEKTPSKEETKPSTKPETEGQKN